ncbi:MAG: OmpA family protein [Microcoleus anatoxicus]|uniref:OmpA family protein n=1 Tax=Microcoleus anatoxicus TaxID=2705319 RepID=UPI00366AAAD6
MTSQKENPADEHELQGWISKPDESADDEKAQLEPLVSLLVDLNIIAGSNRQNPKSEPDSSDEDDRTQLLGGFKDLLGISEEVGASAKPETFEGEADSGDALAFLEDFKKLLFVTQKLNTSELEKDYSSLNTIDVLAIGEVESEQRAHQIQDLSTSPIQNASQPAPTSQESGLNLEPGAAPQTEVQPSAIGDSPVVPATSEAPEIPYLDAAEPSHLEMPNSLEQPTQISQPIEILGQIKQDFNEADSAMERLQNLIFGSQISDIEQVKNLLAENDLPAVRRLMTTIDEKLGKLEHQLYDPQELIALMLPWIAEILSRKIKDSKEEVVNAIVPIIDEVIRAKTQANKQAMSSAIAELLPDALAQQIHNSPADIAKAIAPEIGMAIKEQIRLDQESIAQALGPEMGKAITAQIEFERDSMVDALYPVIGSTISKYMAEAIKTINEKVSNTLSVEGVKRKIRSKVQGVSEAELILQESIPFTVQAVFLIHKASGLVISEAQQLGDYQLESEMVAGMLTAISSFVNDCIVRPGQISELNQIEYGESKIMLEVAGYCYLAAVIKGEPPPKFIKKMRETVSTIIINHGKSINQFNGNPRTISDDLHALLLGLLAKFTTELQTPAKLPLALAGLSLALLSLMVVPWGIYQYRSNIDRRLADRATLALESTPELAVYRLNVSVEGKTLKLTGKLPNPELRVKAGKIAASTAPNLKLDNQIVAVDLPPDPVLTKAEVQRITAVLNKLWGVSISSRYDDRRVTVEGTVMEQSDVQKITESFKQIPGVQSVISTVKLDPLKITSRIYFEPGTAKLDSTYQETIVNIRDFLRQHPQKSIKIIGHSDRTGEFAINQQLSLRRAATVRDALVLQGADPQRLQAVASNSPPADVAQNQPLLLSRCVLFEPITKSINSK